MASIVPILAHAFPPENITGAQRPFRFFKYLRRAGFETHAVCARPDLEPAEFVHRVPAASRRRVVAIQSELLRLAQRFALPYNDELPWVPHAVAKVEELLETGRVAAVISTFPPVATHAAGLWLARKHGVRWIADYRDPHVDNPFRTRKWLFNYDWRMERAIFKSASVVVANTDAAAGIWKNRYPEFAAKLHVIWNGFDPESPLEPAPRGTSPVLTIAHVGTLYGGRHPGLFLESLERLFAAGGLDPAATRVELTGPVDDAAAAGCRDVVARLSTRGIVAMTDRAVPQALANAGMAAADMLLMLDINDRETSVQVPAKLFDYARTGRPILAFTSAGSPLAHILRKAGIDCALIHREAAPADVDRIVGEFIGRGRRPSQANEWFWNTFDGQRQAMALARIIGDPGTGRNGVLEQCPEKGDAVLAGPDTIG